MLLQQVLSRSQTQVRQPLSSQLAPACGPQQSPPGVGVAAGVSVGGGKQGQLVAHSTDASLTQVESHPRVQQSASIVHTQSWHALMSHPGPRPVDVSQHGPPGVGVGIGVREQLQASGQSKVSATQISSQSWPARQHNGSTAQTQLLQAMSSQFGPPCALQQSPAGVGVGV
jgi:hypothetical protein